MSSCTGDSWKEQRAHIRRVVANTARALLDSDDVRILGDSPRLAEFLSTMTNLRSSGHEMTSCDLTTAFYEARRTLIEADPSMEAVVLRSRTIQSVLGSSVGFEIYFYAQRFAQSALLGQERRLTNFFHTVSALHTSDLGQSIAL